MSYPRMMAGVPALNAGLYRTAGFLVGDPVVWIELGNSKDDCHLILRDIELERARKFSRAGHCWCPNDFSPTSGLSGDRETATAQSAAEFFIRKNIAKVTVDRSIPMIYSHALIERGIQVECDTEWGLIERRKKSDEELEKIAFAQKQTEVVMERACRFIATATPNASGVLHAEGSILTAERLQSLIDVWLLELGFSSPGSIVACGPIGADCHDHGHGPLMTGQPVIVDIFPRDKKTLYNGDCTRTVVHGDIPPKVAEMHAAVARAKAAACKVIRAGVSGEAIHQATIASITGDGFNMGLPPADADDNFVSMTHGTGHGLGLEVHEPPLLAIGGPELVVGDVVTVEPGLYCKAIGGVRLEDMVVVTEHGHTNFNKLYEGLDWS
ncbi:M24 family metallopeptidase [Pirellulaceae bacterium SH449]